MATQFDRDESRPSGKAIVKRGAKRATYSNKEINDILDSSFLCHVGVSIDGQVKVIPTAYVRIGDGIYLHGHLHNKMMEALVDGQTACITVTLVDGMVLARSAFHHSVNYRSVVLFGKGTIVESENKVQILDALIDHYTPNRSKELRPHTEQELNATLVIKFSIEEASAKIRTGPPIDAEKDYERDTWAGVLMLKTSVSNVEPCPRLKSTTVMPKHVLDFIEHSK